MNESITSRFMRKFGFVPKWAEDFPVEAADDTRISRTEFIRFLFLVSGGIFAGTFGVLLKGLLGRDKKSVLEPVKLAGPEEISIGASRVVRLPGSKEPVIMVRLGADRYVAYSQKCTHLQCPVLWKPEQNKLVCPCHKGAFDVESGKVLYGPPERPLPPVRLAVKPDGVYFAGT